MKRTCLGRQHHIGNPEGHMDHLWISLQFQNAVYNAVPHTYHNGPTNSIDILCAQVTVVPNKIT